MRSLTLCVMASLSLWSHSLAAQTPRVDELAQLTLEQLSEIKITTVSKQTGNVLHAPAAVYVITREMIRRSGATSIPQALRLAPGVEVARRGSHEWAISIRGFNNRISNKLLVLIDGRSVYSPLYAGVFWDVQSVLLEDVDRIEVISGPGGTLWGANAVNGVINIITRPASETQGGFVEIGGGNERRGFAGLRYGWRMGRNIAMRAYVKTFERDGTETLTGADAGDDWHMAQGGFRLDWEPPGTDSFTLQGDIYRGREYDWLTPDFTLGRLPGPDFRDTIDVSGGNLLGRWVRQGHDGSNTQWQIYYDHVERYVPETFNVERDTLDFEFQHDFKQSRRHDIIWGAGLRITEDEVDNTQTTAFKPSSRTDKTYSAFIQDKITLRERLFLTLGSKFEVNDYTGFEWQPNLRLAWLLEDRQTLWTAVSRAVRIPSRLDTDINSIKAIPTPDSKPPAYLAFSGNPNFVSEEVLAYEAGYRIQVKDNLSFDAALFFNDYTNLLSLEPGKPIIVNEPPVSYSILPLTLSNELEGQSWGGTLVTKWQPWPNWSLQFHYAYLHLHLEVDYDELALPKSRVSNSPEHQFAIHSFMYLPYNLSLYSSLRYVDDLSAQNIPAYTALDLSLIWHWRENLAVSVTGKNLNNSTHLEFSSDDMNTIERSIYGKITWRF